MWEGEIPTPATAAQRRVLYRATRRSMAEVEQMLYGFLVRELNQLDDAQCHRFERLLEYPDADLLDWMAQIKPVPADVDEQLWRCLVER